VKDAAEKAKAEAAASAEWKKGSNVRGAAKAEAAANKADEAARRRREKAELLKAEEEATGPGKTVKSKFGAASKKKSGGKKKNDLSLLEDSLIGDAEKKTKEKKRLERIKKERESAAQAERDRRAKEEQASKDPLLANTDSMINLSDDAPVGRAANVQSMARANAAGLDGALSAISVSGGDDRHPEKRMKAQYKAYEENMMPVVKQQYPGLKRQQYLDKIYQSWKKSPENPMNQ